MSNEPGNVRQGTPFMARYRLVRPVQGRYLAGVCAALGRATNTDPVLWRVALAVLVCFGGVGVLIYLLLWLITPEEGDTASPVEAMFGQGRSSTSPVLVVVLLVVAAAAFLFIAPRPWYLLLLGTVAVLAVVLLAQHRAGTAGHPPATAAPPYGGPAPSGEPAPPGEPAPSGEPAPPAAPPAPPAPSDPPDQPHPADPSEHSAHEEHGMDQEHGERNDQPARSEQGEHAPPGLAQPVGGPSPGSAPSTGAIPATAAPTSATMPVSDPDQVAAGETAAPGGTAALAGGAGLGPGSGYREPFAPHGPFAGAPPPPPTAPPYTAPPPADHQPPAPRDRSPLGAITFFATLLTFGVLGALELSGLVDLPLAAYIAAGLAVCGGGLLVGAWVGRARSLIALGLVLALALPFAHAADRWEQSHSVGTAVTWAPMDSSEVDSSYRINFGEGTLDLREVEITEDEVVTAVRASFGELTVLVPPDATVVVEANLRLAGANVLGQSMDGLRTSQTVTVQGEPDGGTIRLEASVNIGHLEVRR